MKTPLSRMLAVGLSFAAPAALAQTSTANQNLTANMAAAVQITVGADPAEAAFNAAAANTIPMSLTVNSTSPYTIHATAPTASNGANQGKFNEYNTTIPDWVTGGNFINAAHSVAVPNDADGTGGSSVLPNAVGATALVYTGSKAEAGKSLTATLSVTPPFGTPRLTAAGRIYRMVITYTLTVFP